ncbi:MAG: bifunctional enoyl-CoA hydratase/phosphate acetyltransferase [Spirochaetales bacterium]|nr:bifunctional enoyl-CoA hydratase/phosphate acetyltransferase [Spirochaetales bacterium]
MNNFKEMLKNARSREKCRIAVAQAADATVLEAVKYGEKEGIIKPVLVGAKEAIERKAGEAGLSNGSYRIVEPGQNESPAVTAVRLIKEGEADILMKGLIPTGELLKEVLRKENGLNTGKTLSHVAVFKHPGFERFIFVTDAGLNIAPDLAQKKDIAQNAIDLAQSLGLAEPIAAAAVCAVEVVNPSMPATIDAAALAKMSERGVIKGGRIEGPLALDNAVSTEAAQHKGIKSPLAGRADILIAPDIEAGNVLYKSLIFFGSAETAGLIVGARVPVVLTSRSDSAASKLYSIALGVLSYRT